jgi:predicted RNA-binding Zn-ribbon protein involved in translation (DUF1610 family)
MPPMRYVEAMEKICSHCHAELAPETEADWCPACGGSLVEREPLSGQNTSSHSVQPNTVDHRGIVLPRRHAVGGVITPR